MGRTRSTALEWSVITLLEGLNRFYGIPTLALGPGTVHTVCFQMMSIHLRQWSQTLVSSLMWSKSFQPIYSQLSHKDSIDFTLAGSENPMVF